MGDTKLLHRRVNNLTGTVDENPMPEHSNSETLAEDFADFFLEKIRKIQRDLDNYELFKPSQKGVPILDNFTLL